MPRLPIPLRKRPVLWLLLPALPLMVIVANASQPVAPVTGYWAWTVAHSTLLLLVPAGVAATGAALEAGRLRARRNELPAITRARFRVLADALWPSLVAGLALQALAIALVAVSWPAGGAFPVTMAATIALLIAAHAALGLWIGSLTRPVVAVPLALITSYCWLGYTGSVTWPTLRHLAGLVIETCCSYETQAAPSSLLAASAFSVFAAAAFVVAAAGALRLGTIRPKLWHAAAATLLAAAFVLGLSIARDLGPTATEPRSRGDLQCSSTAPTVCLYPEQLANSAPGQDPREQIAAQVRELEALGIAPPARVVAALAPATVDELAVTYRPGMSDADIAHSLASTVYSPDPGRCDAAAATARYAAADVLSAVMVGHLLDTQSVDELSQSTAADPVLLRAYFAATAQQQHAWVREASAVLQSCDGDVPPVPGGPAWPQPTEPLDAEHTP